MPYLTLFLAICFAIAPFLSPEFGGFDPERFPIPQNKPPVQPAGYAFAIWGVIYLWLILGLAFGAIKRRHTPAWQPLQAPLCVSLAVGVIWLPVALTSPVWATLLILIMLATAIAALLAAPEQDRWAALWPLGLYAGWLSAAACVSVGFVGAGFGYVSAPIAAWVMLGIASGLAFGVQMLAPKAPTYALAVIWAFVAVGFGNAWDLSGPALMATLGIAAMLWGLWRIRFGMDGAHL